MECCVEYATRTPPPPAQYKFNVVPPPSHRCRWAGLGRSEAPSTDGRPHTGAAVRSLRNCRAGAPSTIQRSPEPLVITNGGWWSAHAPPPPLHMVVVRQVPPWYIHTQEIRDLLPCTRKKQAVDEVNPVKASGRRRGGAQSDGPSKLIPYIGATAPHSCERNLLAPTTVSIHPRHAHEHLQP